MRLIDANALKRLIKSGDDLIFDHVTECEILHMIDYQETIDAQPVKRGKWECQENMPFESCSICRYRNYDPVYTPNFCPNCGAKMDGDADDGQGKSD